MNILKKKIEFRTKKFNEFLNLLKLYILFSISAPNVSFLIQVGRLELTG